MYAGPRPVTCTLPNIKIWVRSVIRCGIYLERTQHVRTVCRVALCIQQQSSHPGTPQLLSMSTYNSFMHKTSIGSVYKVLNNHSMAVS